MPLEIVTIPCLADNYAFLIHDNASGKTALVDAPESFPVERELESRGWTLDDVWLTHHHWDHIDALPELLENHKPRVIGAKADQSRLPALDLAVSDGECFDFAGHSVRVMDVSGHTVGHIAFYLPDGGAVFTGDSLMALGCGRLFEGSAAQMWQSLSELTALPPETLVFSGHEYTAANAKFALTIEPDNPALAARIEQITAQRAAGQPTVPAPLSTERATNPFLRANQPRVKAALGMTGTPDVEVFAEIRKRKDSF